MAVDIVPDIIAPTPEEPVSEPSSPITSWSPTQEDQTAQRDMAYLQSMFPSTLDKILLCAMGEGHNSPAATTAWVMAINDTDKILNILTSAFPTAPSKVVKDALLSKNGNVTAAYVSLAQRYQSAWDEGYAGDFKILAQITDRLIVVEDTPTPEFSDPNPFYAPHKAKWWDTMVSTKEYKVPEPVKVAHWSKVTMIVNTTVDISPRVCSYVKALRAWWTDRMAFAKAMGDLSTFHDFATLVTYCNNHTGSRETVISIILALLEDGLASPGAAAWVVECLSNDPQGYRLAQFHFAMYSHNRHMLWNQHNQSLHAWKESRVLVAGSGPMKSAALMEKENTEIVKMEDISQPDDAEGGALTQLEPILGSRVMRDTAESRAASPGPTPPHSLPGTAGWALPVSSSATKYTNTVPSWDKRSRSASVSGAGTPLEECPVPLKRCT